MTTKIDIPNQPTNNTRWSIAYKNWNKLYLRKLLRVFLCYDQTNVELNWKHMYDIRDS